MMTGTFDFCIAEHFVEIIIKESSVNSISLLSSFQPFAVDKVEGNLLFRLTVDDDLKPVRKEDRKLIRTFDTGNGDTRVDRLADGGYQFIIRDINNVDCCLLITDKKFENCRCALNGNCLMRSFGLNSALMLIMAFAGAHHQTLLVHASTVRYKDKGYAFIAKSGSGKSTQVSMWLRYIPCCDLMNDDNPIIRIVDGETYIYGSPWSGKTPCYRNIRAKLGAITRIERASENSIEKLNPLEAFASFLPSCSSMKWDVDIYDAICDTVSKIIELNDIYTLHCLPDRESALLCNKTIAR